MNIDSTDTDGKPKRRTCVLLLDIIRPLIDLIIYIIVWFGCWLQMVVAIGLIIFIIAVAICVYTKVHREVDDVLQHPAVQFADNFLGLAITSRLTEAADGFDGRLFLITLLFLLIPSSVLYGCVLLYRGLLQEKTEKLFGYFIGNAIFLGTRIWFITAKEYHNFPEDLTVLYCGLYGLYLAMVLRVAVVIYRKQKRQELLQAVMAATDTGSDQFGFWATAASRITNLRAVTMRLGDDESTSPYVPA